MSFGIMTGDDLLLLSNQIKGYVDILAAPPYSILINFALAVALGLPLIFWIYEMNAAKD